MRFYVTDRTLSEIRLAERGDAPAKARCRLPVVKRHVEVPSGAAALYAEDLAELVKAKILFPVEVHAEPAPTAETAPTKPPPKPRKDPLPDVPSESEAPKRV